MVRVAFALRADARTKPGGDSKKVLRYRERLGARGIDTEVAHSREELEAMTFDVLHLLNLDLPLENLRYAQVAHRRSVPVVLSTIHHPWQGVEKFYNGGEDRFYKVLRRSRIPANRGVLLREAYKLARTRSLNARLGASTVHGAQQKLIDRTSAVLPMSFSEQHALDERFELPSINKVVRNGYTFSGSSPLEAREPFYDAIAVGRIEPRKNSLELARRAAEEQLHVAFAGSANMRHPGYYAAFSELAKMSPYVTHLGNLQHAELRGALSISRAYINPAWMEVVSQADNEAAAMGTPIVTTMHSYGHGELQEDPPSLDPESIAKSGDDVLRDILRTARPVEVPNAVTWDQAGDKLAEVYDEVLTQ